MGSSAPGSHANSNVPSSQVKSSHKASESKSVGAQASPTFWSLYCRQLCALLWKCSITRRVHYITTFFEMIGPLIMPFFIVMTSGNMVEHKADEPLFLGPVVYDSTLLKIVFNEQDFKLDSQRFTVLYSPKSDETAKLVSSLNASGVQLIGVNSESDMANSIEEAMRQSINKSASHRPPIIGIAFGHKPLSKEQISYRILVPASEEFSAAAGQPHLVRDNQGPSKFDYTQYYRLTQVAAYINKAFIDDEWCTADADSSTSCDVFKKMTNIEFYRMPYPRYRNPAQSGAMPSTDMAGWLLVMGYVLMCPLIVKRICDEKTGKIKELLKMMGMSDFVFWSTHFLNYLVLIVLQIFMFVLIFYCATDEPFLQQTSPSLLVTFFLIWGVQLILFSMLLTTIFSSSTLAVIATFIIWMVSNGVIQNSLVIPFCKDKCGDIAKGNYIRRWCTILPTGSMPWFFSTISDLNHKGSGLTWSNFANNDGLYQDFTIEQVLLLMMASWLLYVLLIFYLDNVSPCQPGIPKSPLFVFQPSYWSPQTSKSETFPYFDPYIFEPCSKDLSARIQIQNVCKSFGGKAAVTHLWLNIYQDQLTVLLGHNGAGKSTTMNMITGMLSASSGSIYVNRYNVFTQTNAARRSIGLCPQDNIYFNDLTVGQHLLLFAQLKNYPEELLYKEVNYVLELLRLLDKKNVLADNLSGGMKRKLQLGIALIGDTETLILDEPTSGMDPEARRVIWDLLISIRRTRTILLTTHYMEEADILGDRIAIMNEGKLCCSGSPLFLKNTFGVGYRLKMAKLPGFDASSFEAVLKNYIPGASLSSQEPEIKYSLEGDKSELKLIFPRLFEDLERNKSKYLIESFGLSYSTLEDVFLAVGSDASAKRKTIKDDDDSSNAKKELLLTTQSELETGSALFMSRLKGLLIKRFYFALRYWPMLVLQIIIPAIIIAFAMYLDKKSSAIGDKHDIVLNTAAFYSRDIRLFYYSDREADPLYAEYRVLNEDKYKAKVEQIPLQPAEANPIDGWLLSVANKSMISYIYEYIYGLEVTNGSLFQPWFNNEQLHSMPLSLIAMFEALLRSVVPDNLKSTVSINVTCVSITENLKHEKDQNNVTRLIISFILVACVFMPLAFPSLGASYVLFPVKEQSSKSKLLQLMTGLSGATYWLVNFVFDFITHLIATGILFMVIGFMDSDLFGSGDTSTAPALFLLILAFGISTIPLAYAFSFYFDDPSSGFVFLLLIYLFFGFIMTMIFGIINIFSIVGALNGVIEAIRSIFLPILRTVPIFSFIYGYQKVYIFKMISSICKPFDEQVCAKLFVKNVGNGGDALISVLSSCCPQTCGDICVKNTSAFNFSSIGAGTELCYLLITGLIFITLVILAESYKLNILKFFSRPKTGLSSENSKIAILADSDVQSERDRIEEEIATGKLTDLLTVHELSKSYGSLIAVDRLTFGVHPDECFGFLGVNGAGKTTTFSMLTGDLVPCSGDAFIKRHSLMEEMTEFRSQLGYCPQFDALLDQLTGDDMLYLYARLRGVPPQRLERDIDNLVRMVGLEEHRSKLTQAYSGGTRRKLSIAIALMGSPSLILLDEPSAGVDPASRRKLWKTLSYIKHNLKSSFMLTSHSMEECEALCSRLAIMVNGKFRCLGATQHLRQKYGQGYSVAISLKRGKEASTGDLQSIQQELVSRIPSATLKDYHQCLMHYHISDTSETWSHIFAVLNELNQQFGFEDYYVADTTLEQIFITFARHQV